VKHSIELQELEGQLELDWEIQLIVALLGSQTNFAHIYILKIECDSWSVTINISKLKIKT
jgi:hypothetical protein